MVVQLSTDINKIRTKGGELIWKIRLYIRKLNMETGNIKKIYRRTNDYASSKKHEGT